MTTAFCVRIMHNANMSDNSSFCNLENVSVWVNNEVEATIEASFVALKTASMTPTLA